MVDPWDEPRDERAVPRRPARVDRCDLRFLTWVSCRRTWRIISATPSGSTGSSLVQIVLTVLALVLPVRVPRQLAG